MEDHQYMTNGEGHLVPIESVKAEDRLENDFVVQLYTEAQQLHDKLTAFKDKAFGETDTFLDLLAEKYKVQKGGKKGNVTFLSFDGLTKVQVSNADFISFGPQLQIAKHLIDDFIKEESGGINANIRTIIFHAFRVDKEGKVNKAEILGLRKLDIKGDKWHAAMEAITDSIRVGSTKRYIRFYRRHNLQEDWTAVTLDLAKA